MPDAKVYVIWSNEHRMWWGKDSKGYAFRLTNAGLYTRAEALEICRDARGGWRPEGPPPEMTLLFADAVDCYDFGRERGFWAGEFARLKA